MRREREVSRLVATAFAVVAMTAPAIAADPVALYAAGSQL
jgi:hypothetical protein